MLKKWDMPEVKVLNIEDTEFGGRTFREIDLNYIGDDGLAHSDYYS